MPGPAIQTARLQTRLLRSARNRYQLQRAAQLFQQGDNAKSLYFLESGLIKLTSKLDQGSREVLVRFVRPGEIFGERALRPDETRECCAAAARTSLVSEFPRREFLDLCHRHPDLWFWFAEMFTDRLHQTEKRVKLVSFYRVEQRILHSLADLADQFSNGDDGLPGVSIPLSQSELADLVGATRETTSTTLNSLERRGLVQLGRRHLTVPSAEALRGAAAVPKP
jgi:CRP-like cAMP-binding protein